MNDLVRPAMYQAHHRVVAAAATEGSAERFRVVGPVCESSDDFGYHELRDPPPALVAVMDAGAYGYTMASRYNGRALPAEVYVRDGAILGAVPRRPVEEWAAERLGLSDTRG